jgi:hypothetical protein
MNINRETVLTDEMNMEKVCAKILLKISAVNKNMKKCFSSPSAATINPKTK